MIRFYWIIHRELALLKDCSSLFLLLSSVYLPLLSHPLSPPPPLHPPFPDFLPLHEGSDSEKGATLPIGGATVVEVCGGVIPLETDRCPLNLISHDSRGSSWVPPFSTCGPRLCLNKARGLRASPSCRQKLRFHHTDPLTLLCFLLFPVRRGHRLFQQPLSPGCKWSLLLIAPSLHLSPLEDGPCRWTVFSQSLLKNEGIGISGCRGHVLVSLRVSVRVM